MTLTGLRSIREMIGSLYVRICSDTWNSSVGIWMFFLGLNWGLRVRRKPTGAVPSPPTALGHLLSASLTTEVSTLSATVAGLSWARRSGFSVKLLSPPSVLPSEGGLCARTQGDHVHTGVLPQPLRGHVSSLLGTFLCGSLVSSPHLLMYSSLLYQGRILSRSVF